MNNSAKLFIAIPLSAILAACGGGGDSDGFDYIPPSYGSIAVNQATGAAAITANYDSQSRANDAVVSKCGANCGKVFEFGSNQCGTLARGSNLVFGWASSWRKSNAESDARDQCVGHGGLNCVVVLSECNAS